MVSGRDGEMTSQTKSETYADELYFLAALGFVLITPPLSGFTTPALARKNGSAGK